ncbi:peptidase inhibitor family I36 protein [Streptomyces sp. NPDC087440]|uniref:peptidase inhibitor family I36 protein n=1 Tax=Streptomyces sp. NPDC087440 TaxID=3365790 RepID=UPI00382B6B7E
MSARTRIGLLAGAAALASGFAFAPTAGAAGATGGAAQETAANTCNTGYYCVYWNAGYGGNEYLFGGNNPSWARWAIFNDDSSSWNGGTSGMGVILYGDEGYSRPLGCLPQGRGWTQHRPNDDGEGNQWTWSC